MYKNRWKLAAAIGVVAWSLMSPEAEARRQYNPGLKRFMQRDPLNYANGLNDYEYIVGNPMHGRDPSGREIRDQCEVACPSNPNDGPEQQGCVPPWCPSGSDGCVFCDQGQSRICFDPDRVDMPNPPPGQKCNVDASGISEYAKCLCSHENMHMDDIAADDQGCGGPNSQKCQTAGSVTGGYKPACCDPCFTERTECKAYRELVRCLNGISTPTTEPERTRVLTARKRARTAKQWFCSRKDACRQKCGLPRGCE